MDPFTLNPLGATSLFGTSMPLGSPMATGDLAAQRSLASPLLQPTGAMDPMMALQQQQGQLLAFMLALLVQLMSGSRGGGAGLPGLGATGGLPGLGGTAGLPGLDAAGGGGATGGGGGPAGVNATGGSTATPSGGNGSGPVQIGPGTKVLEIGDSHTVGTFGQELERLLEGKGAKVDKQAAVGTSAGHWINGTNGAKRLQDLIGQSKPDVVVINLGANFRGGIGGDVKRLAQIAKNAGCQVVWVGPPRTRQDMANPASLQKFDDQMRAQLQGLGTYISSAPYTSYDGPDGIHYNAGAARKWAAGVFQALAG